MGINQAIDITAEQRESILSLLEQHLPGTTTWACGSRAKWSAQSQSDLDLVVFSAPEQRSQVGALREAFEESNLPFRVDLFVWDEVPKSFHREIEAEHVVLVGGKGNTVAPDRWQTKAFGDCAELIRTPVLPSNAEDVPYIGLKHIGKGTLSLLSQGTAGDVSSTKTLFESGDILFGKLCPSFRKVVRAPFRGICSTDIWVVRAREGLEQRFLYYCMTSQPFVDHAVAGAEGTIMPRAQWDYVSEYDNPLPPLPEQRAIAHVLGTLDDKIELNRRMNETLEAMARALFKSWFVDFDPVRAKMAGRDTGLPKPVVDLFPDRLVASEIGEIPEGWEVKSLDTISCFQNGLALQRYRPAQDESRLPVIKIAQLRSGKADGGEWVRATIKPECIIENGDVIFSWSGSLIVRIWCGGRAALNQHLFRVTSERYPKWFYLHSILSHLPDFQRIAADKATTMGHIRRHHLTDALCVVPHDALLASVSGIFEELLSRQIANDVKSQILYSIRDELLPKLISGKLQLGKN